jgi:truncated hemoglobin YjbI
MEKVADEWVALSAADPKVDLSRGGQFKLEGEALATVKRRLVGYLSSVSEGTVVYTGRSMKDAHQGMNITAAEFDAMVGHLKTALKKENVGESESNDLVKKIETTKSEIVTK